MDKKTSGFTLIEMLVGIVIGMIVVAAASVMMVSVLKSQKDVTASARLNQELGAAMTVMSNEIRRAGFSVCDVANSDCDGDGNGIEELSIKYNTSASDKDLEIIAGNCVLYRYNANLDIVDDAIEQRGFRLNGNFIQMAGTTGVVTCGDDANWVALTDPKIIKITDLNFSTTGSKCRNMHGDDPNYGKFWTVGKVDVVSGEIIENTPPDTKQACELADGTGVVIYDDSGVPGNGNFELSWKAETMFGARQVIIKLEAVLARDQAVSKTLMTSVKVANPLIETAP